MTRPLRELATCWVHQVPNLEVGAVVFHSSYLTDVSSEIYRASEYDPEAAFSLIERFCVAAVSNSDIDARLLDYVVTALQALTRNNELNLSLFAQTLGIKPKSHRPPTNRKRDWEIFREVREKKLTMSYENACFTIAEARGLSDETVKSIYKARKKEWHEFLRLSDEDELSWNNELFDEDESKD